MWGTLTSSNPKIYETTLNTRFQEYTIGKSSKCLVSIPDAAVSGVHCCIFLKDNQAFIVDKKSKNGTFLNHEKLEPGENVLLKDNDFISLASSKANPHFDETKNITFRFTYPSKTGQKAKSKFDNKTKLVSTTRGVAVATARGGNYGGGTGKLVTAEDYRAHFANPAKKVTKSFLEDLQKSMESDSKFLKQFLDLGGISLITKDLQIRLKKSQQSLIDKLISLQEVKVLQQIMDEKIGFLAILNTDALSILSLGLECDHTKLKNLIAMLFVAVGCISAAGHKKVLEAMNFYQKHANERTRFKNLVHSLRTEDDHELQTNLLRLINVIISKTPVLEDRVAIRQEFKQLGILDILETLRYDSNPLLDQEINGFFDEMEEDTKESIVNDVDLSDPVAITQAMLTQTHGHALQYFTEIMQQLFSISSSGQQGLATWKTIDQVLRETVQDTDATTTGSATKSPAFNIQTIRKAKQQNSSNTDLSQDQEALYFELESLKKSLSDMKIKHLEEINKLVDKSEVEKKQLQKTLEQEIAALRDRLEQSTPSTPIVVVPGEDNNNVLPPAPPAGGPPPPGPPPPPGGGPPPPPGMGGLNAPKASFDQEYPLKPHTQMKKFYWTNLRDNELQGSFWEKIDFKQVQILEPVELEKLFGAKKKVETKQDTTDQSSEPAVVNPYENIIDLKRANNIGIMLKHFKASPVQIKNAIIKADNLSPEKIAQLLRNCPTLEEIELLSNYQGDPSDLGKAEQFLFQLSQIPAISDRLQALQFQVTFDETAADLKHYLETIIKACRQIIESPSLPKLCEIVLAVGNFLNFNQLKPPVKGFKLDFLTKVGDTRSTDNTITMMHYLTGLISYKEPSLIGLSSELDMVGVASRIPTANLTADISKINNSLKQIKRLLAKDAENSEYTTFREQMLSLSLHVKRKLEEINGLQTDLQNFAAAVIQYLKQSSSATIDETLGIVNDFLLTYDKTISDNKQEQANREMQERLAEKRKQREEAKLNKQQTTAGISTSTVDETTEHAASNVETSTSSTEHNALDDDVIHQQKESDERAPSRPQRGLMNKAFATIRGGGAKTFRAKRGVDVRASLAEMNNLLLSQDELSFSAPSIQEPEFLLPVAAVAASEPEIEVEDVDIIIKPLPPTAADDAEVDSFLDMLDD